MIATEQFCAVFLKWRWEPGSLIAAGLQNEASAAPTAAVSHRNVPELTQTAFRFYLQNMAGNGGLFPLGYK
jgi:hypothetical protein